MTPLYKKGLPRQRVVVRPAPEPGSLKKHGPMALLFWLFQGKGKAIVGYERDGLRGRDGYRATRSRFRGPRHDRRRLKALPREHRPNFKLWRLIKRARDLAGYPPVMELPF